MTEGAGMITTTPTDATVADHIHRNGVPPRRYYKDPAETAATIIDGGWVRTGDLGTPVRSACGAGSG